jgi:hypothetical protein
MMTPLELFLEIIDNVTDGYIQPSDSTPLGELFEDPIVFSPLQFEMCVSSLAATLRRHIDYDFCDGNLMRDARMTLAEFLKQYMRDWVSDDPLFVTREFTVFALRAQWITDWLSESRGNN